MVLARDLSHYIVDKCTRDNSPVSNLQLQKILYFIQSVYCRNRDGKLLFEENFEAWPYGPVISSVYNEFSSFGGRVIEMTFSLGSSMSNLDSAELRFIDEGIVELRRMYPWDLVRIAHSPSSPWAKVYRDGAGYKEKIPNSLIIEFATRNQK